MKGKFCSKHKNEWSKQDPLEKGWWFSNSIKLAHTQHVENKVRKVYYRKTAKEKCLCKLLYNGDEDYLMRIGGSIREKCRNKTVSLISYNLLIDFTLDFMENGQTITGFYNLFKAKCIRKYAMKSEEIIDLKAWKSAVEKFWIDVIKLNLKKSFTCDECGILPPTLVFDGIALGIQVSKVKELKQRILIQQGRSSERELSGTKFSEGVFIKHKKNRNILKEAADMKLWPDILETTYDEDEYTPAARKDKDDGMIKFMAMIKKLDQSEPPSDGLVQLMRNLWSSTSTTSLFQVNVMFVEKPNM